VTHDHTHRFVAMPMGGIGTGTVSIGADGGLRQWQLHNVGNHRGDLPGSFFAIRATQWEPPLDEVRVLQARPETGPATPLVDDDAMPRWQHELASRRGVAGTTFDATYPIARVEFQDATLPVAVRLEVLNPLVPLDLASSSLPVVMAAFNLTNPGPWPVHGLLAGSLRNAVGYDGVSQVDLSRAPGCGGNTNRVRRAGGWTHVLLENETLSATHAGTGQMVLAADDSLAPVHLGWNDPDEFLAFLRGRMMGGDQERARWVPGLPDAQVGGSVPVTRPSLPGQTWNTGLAVPFELAPGASTTIRFLIAWYFPNRYVNFPQFGPPRPEWGPTRFWLGNHYALAHEDAYDVARDVEARWDTLVSATRSWTGVLKESSLDPTMVEHLAAQASIFRSPSCFRTADGSFFGFEGVNGVSTRGHAGDVGGSCPLNCTHVWNYAQGMARLFPELERSMRTTELTVTQAPNGAIPHRVIVPTYLHQLWDVLIGGPDEPALDGMLGVLLKHYREVRQGAGVDWLANAWPKLIRLLDHIRRRWDPEGNGVLRGIQPSTHDIDLRGVNPFMGGLWLAALRATEEMATLVGASEQARELRTLFERGSAEYDAMMFTGTHFAQVLEPDDPPRYQWGRGVLSDQLVGQWWAHLLGLGYVLPRDHVVTALRTVVRTNLRHGFRDMPHQQRVFADLDDTGLLMCSWPEGDRPLEPTRYCDEVWSGSEYQVAAHCLVEGLYDEAFAVLTGLWSRYDGTRRNPYNEIECGDHYVRALAGWSVLDALTGQSWDAVTGTLTVRRPPVGGAWPVVTSTGWGLVHGTATGVELDARWGALAPNRLRVVGGVPDGAESTTP
jgi:uncharacterized protein (DUF608 family)